MATAGVVHGAFGGSTTSRILHTMPLAGTVTGEVPAVAPAIVSQSMPSRVETSAGPTVSLTGMAPGSGYRVRVRAVDGSGNVSDWSEERTFATSPVTSTTVVNVGAVTTSRVAGLTPSTGYTARIRARDAAGNWSDWSSAVPLTTLGAGADPPALTSGLPRPVVRSAGVQLDVTATPPGGQTITAHSWAIVGGAPGSLTNATTATPTYTAPASGSGLVTIRDTVAASGGGAATADVVVSYAETITGAENALAGTPRATWDLASPNLGGVSTLQGFCDGFSVNKSGTANFKIGQSDGAGWTAEVFRLGWYGSEGARSYGTLTPSGPQLTASQSQPAPVDVDATTSLISADCAGWSTTLTWSPPAWAPSGIYILRLNRTGGGASHVMFVVRDDGRRAALTLMPSDSTWNAYNAWGGLGANMYAGNSLYFGTAVDQYNGDCAKFVSYNRPMVNRGAADAGRAYGAVEWSTFFTAEYPVLRFVERNGIDTKYLACIDSSGDPTGTHLKGNGSTRAGSNAAIFVGHNEYWSDSMRSGWEAARDAGVSVFSCAGNEVFWRTVGTSPDAEGRPRLVECQKSTIGGRGNTRPQWTGSWRDPDGAGKGGNSPENLFTGTIFVTNGPDMRSLVVPATGGYAAQPLWRHTAVAALTGGQSYSSPGQILGFEWDTYGSGGVSTTGNNFLAPAHTRARFCSDATYTVSNLLLTDAGDEYGSGNATHRLVVYPGGAGGIVFGVGTVNWGLGLDSANTYQQGNDNTAVEIQQATVNILTDMGAPPTTLMTGLTQPTLTAWFADAAAALPAVATLSTAGARTAPGAGGLAATATLITAAARQTSPSAALAAIAAIASAATLSRAASAALSALATLAAGTAGGVTADAGLPVTATLTTSTAGTAGAEASLPVSAALSTTATRAATSSGALPVTTTLTTIATRTALPSAALPVTAALATSAARDARAGSTLTISATLAADSVVGLAPVLAAASLTVTATMSGATVRAAQAPAALGVTAALSASMARTAAAPASTLAITVSLTAGGQIASMHTVGGVLAVVAVLLAAVASDADVRQFVSVDSVTRVSGMVEPGAARVSGIQ